MAKYTACESCHKELLEACPWAASFWLELVNNHIPNRYWYYVLDDGFIRVLEEKGYVLSHENESKILFVLLGKQENTFCIRPDDHQIPTTV